jgi:Zn finger protein HypA/HybF involved in hydrogenase expression
MDEFNKIEFDFTCPFCKEPIKLSLNQDKFNCPKCNAEFQTTLESKDLTFVSHFVEEEDEQE